jgi:predicted metal-dependent hydrolase
LKVYKDNGVRKPSLRFYQGKFTLEVHNLTAEDEMSSLFKDWYIEHGKQKLQERVERYCYRMNVSPTKVQWKDQQARWGTCTKSSNIYLNWKLIMAPISIIDYVLVHELAHLRYMDHSKDYWTLVHLTLPDYEERKEWLRINGPKLCI